MIDRGFFLTFQVLLNQFITETTRSSLFSSCTWRLEWLGRCFFSLSWDGIRLHGCSIQTILAVVVVFRASIFVLLDIPFHFLEKENQFFHNAHDIFSSERRRNFASVNQLGLRTATTRTDGNRCVTSSQKFFIG